MDERTEIETDLDLENLPDLETPIGVAGTMRHVEVGGHVCFGVVIAVAAYAAK